MCSEMRLSIKSVLLGLVLFMVGCQNSATSEVQPTSSAIATAEVETADVINVVTSTSILADWVENVGGDKVQVNHVIPSGTDPHTFSPTPSDIKVIEEADIVFLVGANYEESWLAKLTAALPNAEQKLRFLSDGVSLKAYEDSHDDHGDEDKHDAHDDDHGDEDKHDAHDDDHADEDKHDADDDHGDEDKHDAHDDDHADEDDHSGHGHGEFDPHFWHDPITVVEAAQKIAKDLGSIFKEDQSVFDLNADTYVSKLKELDTWIVSKVDTIPESNRVLITSHETMTYLSERYGFEVSSSILQSLSSAESVTPKDLAAITEVIDHHGVPAIFADSYMSTKIEESLASETGVKVIRLNMESLGGTTTSYIDMMKENVTKLTDGLNS